MKQQILLQQSIQLFGTFLSQAGYPFIYISLIQSLFVIYLHSISSNIFAFLLIFFRYFSPPTFNGWTHKRQTDTHSWKYRRHIYITSQEYFWVFIFWSIKHVLHLIQMCHFHPRPNWRLAKFSIQEPTNLALKFSSNISSLRVVLMSLQR